MTVHRVTICVLDFENWNADEIRRVLDRDVFSTATYPSVMSVESRTIEHWTDDHPLNRKDTEADAMRELFDE